MKHVPVVLLCLLMFAPCLLAAEAPAGPDAAHRMLAHRFGQLARSIIREPQPTHPQRMFIARTLLNHAVELDSTDVELRRLQIEALEHAGETEPLRAALSAYLKLEPHDDVAQLKLVDLIAADQQTVAERITVYERLVDGAGAARLSPALRSRLALRAARLHLEQGRLEDYGRMLKSAVQLDETHKAAAIEAYRFLQDRGAGPVEVAQALLNVAAADPSDGDAHAEIATLLLSCGSYTQAVEWFGTASALWGYQGLPPAGQVLDAAYDWALSLWGAGRGDEALAFIDSFVKGWAPEAEATMPASLAMLVAAIHHAAGREAEADAAYQALAQTLRGRAEQNADNPDRMVDRVWAAVLLNQEIEATKPLLDQLEKQLPAGSPILVRLRGWWLLRADQRDQARQALAACAETDPLCRLGLALAQEPDQRERQVELLQRVFAAAPGSLAGVLAVDHLHRLDARPQQPPECVSITRLIAQVPLEVRSLASQANRVVMLRLRPLSPAVGYAEPPQFQVDLINLSPLPLSLGPEGTLPSDVMLVTRASIGAAGEVTEYQPLNLHRRLRLNPNEAVSAKVTVDHGSVAQLLASNPTQAAKLAASAVLNPRMTVDGDFVPGLLGTLSIAPAVQRSPRRVTLETVEAALKQLEGGAAAADQAQQLRTAAWLARIAAQADTAADHKSRITAALRQAWQQWGDTQRAWLISRLPVGAEADQTFATLIDAAVNSDDALVQTALLLTRATDAESPVLLAALRRDPGLIHTLATALSDVLGLMPIQH